AVAGKRVRKDLEISSATATQLGALADEVCRAFDQAMKAIETGDPDDALEVYESKKTVASLAEEATQHIATRLTADEANRLPSFQVATETIEIYKRLNTVSRRIAKLAVATHDNDEDKITEPAVSA
ncbi:MAG: PhoU domain-containing protein, partial [Pseudomonadota bacterium]